MLETLEEVVVKEKHPESFFLVFLVCNSQHESLILLFGIESNQFNIYYIISIINNNSQVINMKPFKNNSQC